jgi:hypothetical protein
MTSYQISQDDINGFNKYFTKDILCIKFKHDLLFETEIYLESVYVICVKLEAD